LKLTKRECDFVIDLINRELQSIKNKQRRAEERGSKNLYRYECNNERRALALEAKIVQCRRIRQRKR